METLKLIAKRKEVIDTKTQQVKRYTNFVLRIAIGNHHVDVPIQPVNFGEKDNRKNYTLLLQASEKDGVPF